MSQCRLTRGGALVPKDAPALAALVKKDLVVTPFSPLDPWPRRLQVYSQTPEHFVVPVHWATSNVPGPWVDERGLGVDVPHLAFVGSLRPDLRQPEAVEAVMSSMKSTGGAMLCSPPGFGKTSMALYIACVFRKKVMVVVHKQFLADQWRERAAQFVPSARVTRVQGDECDVSGDIVVAMVQTLVSRKYPPTTFQDVGLVIADEAHHMAAPTLTHAMLGLGAPYTLGLSATPERKDRLERVVSWLLGPIAFSLKREGQTSTQVEVVKYRCPRYSTPMPLNRRGDVDHTGVVTILAEDEERTATIAGHVARLAGTAGHDVLVLSHRRGHCQRLVAHLTRLGVDAATYLGGDKSIPTSKVIVATFSLTSEGFDCPRLSALVLATPASDVEQACGRVMRGSSARGAVIVDLVDHWGVCLAQASRRRALYTRSGFRIHHAETETHTVQTETPQTCAFLDD